VYGARALGFDTSKKLLDAMIPGSKELVDLTYTFSTMASRWGLNIMCFFEGLPTKVVKGPRALKLIGKRIKRHIVPEEMGCLEIHRKFGLNASHTDMNEFDAPGNGNYILVYEELRRIVQAPQRPPQREGIFSVPYSWNAEFVGREDLLNEIRQRMGFKRDFHTRLGL
jgi:hypothetical protein